MHHSPIEGRMVAATLSRSFAGERVYRGVVIRRRDGADQRIGRVTVPAQLADVMAEGSEGRFFLHDVMGSRGLHAFAAADGSPRTAFPRLTEIVFAVLAAFNLLIVAVALTYEAGLPIVPLALGVLATSAWAACRGTREAILLDFGNRRYAAARTHRQAVLGAFR